MQRNPTSFDLDLTQVARLIRRRGPLILLCAVVTAILAFAVSAQQQKQYVATASILYRDVSLDQEAAGLPAVSAANQQSATDTNLTLVKLPRIATATASAIGHGTTPSQVRDAVTITQNSDTNVVNVAAEATSPKLAANIANTYANQAIADRQRSDGSYYANALRAIELQYKALTPSQQHGGQGADLSDRTTSLQILSQLQGKDIELAQQANPPGSPSSPKIARNTALGALLGLLLGFALAFVAERFDRRLREPADLEDVYGVPLLAVVPDSSALRDEAEAAQDTLVLPDEETEIFSLLRAHIRYFNVDHELRTVAVVSAAPGDGKTTIGRNLALAAATIGPRVLFIEADLRRPSASKHFGIKEGPGVVDVLTTGTPLEGAVQEVRFTRHGKEQFSLDVLVAGEILPPNPAQVTESHGMKALMEHARSVYDLIIVDTPPLVMLPDAFPLLQMADGVLIVSRLGRNRRDVAVRLRETLTSADASVIGVVANRHQRSAISPYGYGSTYSEYVRAGRTSDTKAPPSEEETPAFEPELPDTSAPATSANGTAPSTGVTPPGEVTTGVTPAAEATDGGDLAPIRHDAPVATTAGRDRRSETLAAQSRPGGGAPAAESASGQPIGHDQPSQENGRLRIDEDHDVDSTFGLSTTNGPMIRPRLAGWARKIDALRNRSR